MFIPGFFPLYSEVDKHLFHCPVPSLIHAIGLRIMDGMTKICQKVVFEEYRISNKRCTLTNSRPRIDAAPHVG